MPNIEKAREKENEKKCFITIHYPEAPPTFLFLPMSENKKKAEGSQDGGNAKGKKSMERGKKNLGKN